MAYEYISKVTEMLHISRTSFYMNKIIEISSEPIGKNPEFTLKIDGNETVLIIYLTVINVIRKLLMGEFMVWI